MEWTLWTDTLRFVKGRKKHINFFNINFLHPTRNPPFWAPRKKFMCLISWERTQRGTHINFFGGILGVKNGVPNEPFSARKSLVYCFFPALICGGSKSRIHAAIYRSAPGPRARKCLPECFLRARCPKALKKHSGRHFRAQGLEHSCKWRLGSHTQNA